MRQWGRAGGERRSEQPDHTPLKSRGESAPRASRDDHRPSAEQQPGVLCPRASIIGGASAAGFPGNDAHCPLACIEPLHHSIGLQGADITALCTTGNARFVRRPITLFGTRLAAAVVPQPAAILHDIFRVGRQKHFFALDNRKDFGPIFRNAIQCCSRCDC